jgi:predicted component of type VI protein secretion system
VMPFNAKKLRVVLPDGEIVGADKPKVLPIALDLEAVGDEAVECFTAVHQLVTGWCISHSFQRPGALGRGP